MTATLFHVPSRDPEQLMADGLAVLDRGMSIASVMRPLYSGGNDSMCACHLASLHPAFPGVVHHIDTGIGAAITRRHVDAVCRDRRWTLTVWNSPATYEQFVRDRGFPGPGRHQWVYNRIKERCIRQMCRKGVKTALVTGCRSEESTRRMGHVAPIQVGETSKKTGKTANKNRVWTAPCHDWTKAEQVAYMNHFDLPRNPLSDSLGMSGECFCGAFAAPGELDLIRRHVPDVADKIDALTVIARKCGTHDKWGIRPPEDPKGVIKTATGMLCSGCDRRAIAAGLFFEFEDQLS